jgi:hypothetical protein
MSEELAETAEVVARGRGISVNALVLQALAAEIDRAKADSEFMDRLRALAERDREILHRLAPVTPHLDPADEREAVEDYDRRVASGEPYEDAIDPEAFSERYRP